MRYDSDQTDTRWLYLHLQVAQRLTDAKGMVLAVNGENILARVDVYIHSRYSTAFRRLRTGFLVREIQGSFLTSVFRFVSQGVE